MNSGATTNANVYFFGDLINVASGDVSATILTGDGGSLSNYSSLGTPNVSTGAASFMRIARSYHQLGSSQAIGTAADPVKQRQLSYPQATDGLYWLSPIVVYEARFTYNYIFRGNIPGLWCMDNRNTTADGERITFATGDLAGKTFECRYIGSFSSLAALFLEISNTF
jgi:hypothetical protein